MRTEQTLQRSVSKSDIKFSGTSKKRGLIHPRKTIFVFSVIVLITMVYSLLEPYWIETKNYTIYSPDIPSLFDGYSIVFLSDIHHGRNYSIASVKNLVKKVSSLNPDLVLLGGDYVEGRSKYIEPCFNTLGELSSSFGFITMGVLGNHDHWQGASLTRRMMAENGIICLDNRAVWIRKSNQRLRIGGVGDHCEDTQDLFATVKGTKESDFVILLSHNPDFTMDFSSKRVDLILSGHTHGGQVTFFGLFAPKVPSTYGQKFRTGRVNHGTIQTIISNGIGTVFLPVRFFARPQIVVLHLKHIKKSTLPKNQF